MAGAARDEGGGVTSLSHMTPAQAETYRNWLTRLARRASGRMREWLTAQLQNLDGSEWSYLP